MCGSGPSRRSRTYDDKIRSLQKMKRSLKKVISECETKNSIDDCPLLEGIDSSNGRRATET